ncbi:MAG: 16S rRNA (cytosine(1402)-N(4))-methyltransferase RsmH [Marinibacterium sp.]
MAAAAQTEPGAAHVPVLLDAILASVAPVRGAWLDGTFGAGGYARGLLKAGADRVIGVDRDPLAIEMAADWAGEYGDRLVLQPGVFSRMDSYARDLDGVVLDLGVSSMQLDLAERGFSFLRNGPLDMRMSQSGPSAADLVNSASEAALADILYLYGEERASRRIARAIVRARSQAPIRTTAELTAIIESCLPRARPGQSHPATRSFQALRIAVNDEYGELFRGLMAAERALRAGGHLAVVTFHSVEDRMVKRFIQARSGQTGRPNRYAPDAPQEAPQFTTDTRRAIVPDDREIARNPRARSAKLRVATRTAAPSGEISARAIGMPHLKEDPF